MNSWSLETGHIGTYHDLSMSECVAVYKAIQYKSWINSQWLIASSVNFSLKLSILWSTLALNCIYCIMVFISSCFHPLLLGWYFHLFLFSSSSSLVDIFISCLNWFHVAVMGTRSRYLYLPSGPRGISGTATNSTYAKWITFTEFGVWRFLTWYWFQFRGGDH